MPDAVLDRLKRALSDRYTIDREIGAGGMATVYLAEDLKHQRKVAIKVLRPEITAALGADRFHREIRIAAQLQHPNILPLHDSGDAEGLLYYVMPYVAGESLRDKLGKEGELPINEAVRILREVVDALAHAHEQGVVHRDIKPDNVLLSGRHALVTDFGVAKAVSEATGRDKLTTAGVSLGTPTYMAPEQAAADPHIDHRADIYAVGVVAYELLTGRPPFSGSTPQQVLSAHITEAPVEVSKHRQTVPPQLANLVMRCLEKKPADRWQSAEELLPQLESLTTPSGGLTPTGTLPVSAVDYEAAARRSHPVRVAALIAVGTVAVLAVVYTLLVQFGLPNWVFVATVAVLGVALPVMMLTSFFERKRALAQTTGTRVPTPTGMERHFRWNKSLAGIGMAFAMLAVGTGVYMAMRLLGIGPVGTLVASGVLEQRERLVLARFENSTPDTTLAETVTELLHIDLTQSPTITVMEAAQVGTVLRMMDRAPDDVLTLDLATEVAEREGIKAVVSGEIRSLGNGYVLSARLIVAATGEVLWAGRENAASAAEVVGAVDRLSAELRKRIGESLRTIRSDPPLDRVTTRSAVALRKLVEAESANNLGDPDRAIVLLEEAIAEDSGFAMAWRKLGVVLTNADRDLDRRDTALTRARQLGSRLTERERYLCEGMYYAYVENDGQAAISAYRSVLDKYPDDRTALNNLANEYANLGRNEEAAELRLRSIALGHAPYVTYQGAVSVLYEMGKRDSARQMIQLYAAEYPDHPNMLVYRAGYESATGLYDSAQATLEYLRSSQRGNPQWEYMAAGGLSWLARVRGRLAEARRNRQTARARAEELGLQGTLDVGREEDEGVDRAWETLRFRDDPAAAVRQRDALLRSYPLDAHAPEDRPYFDLVEFYALAGEGARARGFLEAFEAEVDAETQKAEKADWHVARGLVALAEDRNDDAIAEFRLHREALPGCVLCALNDLAEAFNRSGNADSALFYYERYLNAPDITRLGTDRFLLWSTLRRLGELHEQRGDRDNAIRYYNEFVELWKDADPELQPQVEDVRQRIARLVGEPQR